MDLAVEGANSTTIRADTALRLSGSDVVLSANSLLSFSVRDARDVFRASDFQILIGGSPNWT